MRWEILQYGESCIPFLLKNKAAFGRLPMTDDIAYRLNVDSVSQVYSASLPVIILYDIILKKSSVFYS